MLVAVGVAGCGPVARQADDGPGSNGTGTDAVRSTGEVRIPCATGGAAVLARRCVVERADGPRGLVLTLRDPDGGFRRLLVVDDGRGVVAADGAQRAAVSVIGPDVIEVAIAGDRYRLPATVGKPAR